jgi:O-acetyl-ADP-ribose deacetylase (regulator of RNase III)
MSAGIAVQFRNRYGDNTYLFKNATFYGNKQTNYIKPGTIAILPQNDRYIYYLITKPLSSHKPRYWQIVKSLRLMRNHAELNGIKTIAMPKIACGLDQCNWKVISKIINQTFRNSPVKIEIYTK